MAVAEPVRSPPPAPAPVTDERPRCWRCRRTLAAYLTRPWSLTCHRCKAQNQSEPER